MSPAFNISSAIQRFECADVIEIHNRIRLDFYPELPHLVFSIWQSHTLYTVSLPYCGFCRVVRCVAKVLKFALLAHRISHLIAFLLKSTFVTSCNLFCNLGQLSLEF